MKRIQLTETNEIIELNNNEFNGIDINKLSLKDIRSKQELLNLSRIKTDESTSIDIAKEKLKQLNISIKHINEDRFATYDAIAVSAVTNMFNESYNEEIILEFKYRTGTTCNQYQSVVIDSIKARELLNEYKSNNKRIFIIYIYKDNHIRLFEFSKYYKDYSTYKESNVINAKYRSSVKKIKRLIEYPNELTILI